MLLHFTNLKKEIKMKIVSGDFPTFLNMKTQKKIKKIKVLDF